MRLLLVQPRGIGDVLMDTPAIREARRHFRDARIDFLSEAGGADALAGNPYLDEVLLSRRGAGAQWALLREVRGRRYDAVVDFRSTGSSARVVLLSGAGRRVGVEGRGPVNLAYTHRVPRSRGLNRLHTVRQRLALLGPLGLDPAAVADLSLDIAVGEPERAWAAAELERLGLAGEAPLAVVSPVYIDWAKQWGAERWAAVADAAVEDGMRVLLTHGPGQEGQAREVRRAMRHSAVAGHRPTNLRQLAALFQRAALWLGNDGGAKHVAVAAGAPTVCVILHGNGASWTDPVRPDLHRYLEGADAPGDRRGGIDAVAVDDVVAAARELRGVLVREGRWNRGGPSTR